MNHIFFLRWPKGAKSKSYKIFTGLVSTYVVCERLSMMHEPAGVVEILIQILQNTPYSEIQFQNTPPRMKIVREPKSESFRIPPPIEI